MTPGLRGDDAAIDADDTIDEENEDVSDEDVEENTEEISRKVLEDLFDKDFSLHVEALRADIQARAYPVDFEIQSRIFFDSLETRYQLMAHEVVHVVQQRPAPNPPELTPDPDISLPALTDEAGAQCRLVGSQRRDNRVRTRRTALAVLFGLAVSSELAPYLLFHLDDHGDPRPDGDMPPGAAEKAREILRTWRKLPDSSVWTHLAEYVDKNHPSIQAQMMMMGYVKKWAAVDGPVFEWTDREKTEIIRGLLEALQATHQPSSLYRTVSDARHQGKPLPRGVAADCCELALAHRLSRHQPAK